MIHLAQKEIDVISVKIMNDTTNYKENKMSNEAKILLEQLKNTNKYNTLRRANEPELLKTGTYTNELRENGYLVVGTTKVVYLTNDKKDYVQYCQREMNLAKKKVGK